MSAASPGTRIAAPERSEIVQKLLDDEDTKASLSLLLSVVESCYGPKGRLKMIQNVCGGHVTVTSSSARLYPVLGISKPVLKLVMHMVQKHLQSYNDGGLFSSLLSLILIEKSLKTVDLNQNLMCDVFDYLRTVCGDILSSSSCKFRLELDFSNVAMLLTLVQSVFGTKPACCLNAEECSLLCRLVLETFLKTLKDNASGKCFAHVDIMGIAGSSPELSCLKNGILFEKQCSENVAGNFRIKRTDSGWIKCCLVNISLSGDTDLFLDMKFEIDTTCSLEGGIMSLVHQLCRKIVAEYVGVVFCQKVVHPAIKQLMREEGVLVIDRLGSAHTKAVAELTGCTPISSLSAGPTDENWGQLDAVEHLEINRKHFYHLQSSRSQVSTVVLCGRTETSLSEIRSSQSQVSTVVLCGRTETSLSEIRHVFQVGLDTLQMALYDKEVVAGAGCFETALASSLRNHVLQNERSLMDKFSCAKSHLHSASWTFVNSLEAVAKALDCENQHFTDNETGHHWTTGADLMDSLKTCACGMVNNQNYHFREILNDASDETSSFRELDTPSVYSGKPKVLDLLKTKQNALFVAVSCATMVLRVGSFVSDTN